MSLETEVCAYLPGGLSALAALDKVASVDEDLLFASGHWKKEVITVGGCLSLYLRSERFGDTNGISRTHKKRRKIEIENKVAEGMK